jgi:hypothetical protein
LRNIKRRRNGVPREGPERRYSTDPSSFLRFPLHRIDPLYPIGNRQGPNPEFDEGIGEKILGKRETNTVFLPDKVLNAFVQTFPSRLPVAGDLKLDVELYELGNRYIAQSARIFVGISKCFRLDDDECDGAESHRCNKKKEELRSEC